MVSKLKKWKQAQKGVHCPHPQIVPPSLPSIRKNNYKANLHEQDTGQRDDKPRNLRGEAPKYCDPWLLEGGR